jgi:exodeoxyribonuclease VII large subunit
MEQKNLDFGAANSRSPRERKPLTVSELTERIQGVLETEFLDVLVEGEVSNLNLATSGHWYFSLKDDRASIRAVVWKSATRFIRFRPRDGMKVFARGSVRLYAPRGDYQVQIEVLEPLGKGSLQQAFEDLKERLAKEGLFDDRRKKPLPMLPRRIGVVTSPTGSVIQDILRVLKARYANLEVLLYPARVQGPEAAGEIVQGIHTLARLSTLDVIILARGGGSLEELWPFNDEGVARAIATCRVPTISAVGHETDFTIADFVADVRAPTPSAAAERVVKAKEDLETRIAASEGRLGAALALRLERVRSRVLAMTAHRVFEAERGRLRTRAQTIDEAVRRSGVALERRLERGRGKMDAALGRLQPALLLRGVKEKRRISGGLRERAQELVLRHLASRRGALREGAARLASLSPLAVLSRGYALVFAPSGALVKDAASVRPGEEVRVQVEQGAFRAVVREGGS